MASEEYEDLIVRILLLDAYERLLLLHQLDDGVWRAPGGAVAHGEDWGDALRRTLWAATGYEPVETGAWVWTRRELAVDSDGVRREHLERYYLIRTEVFEIEPGALWQGEPVDSVDHHWWPNFAIQEATAELFAPSNLSSHLEHLILGRFPLDPIDIGA